MTENRTLLSQGAAIRAQSGDASPPAAWEPTTSFTLEWCGEVDIPNFLLFPPPLSLPSFPFKIFIETHFLILPKPRVRPSAVAGAARHHAPVHRADTGGGGLWGPLASVAHAPMMAGSPLLASPFPLPTSIVASPGSRAEGGPPRWRAPQAGNAPVPGAAGVATLHQRPSKASHTTPTQVTLSSTNAAAEPVVRGRDVPGVGSGEKQKSMEGTFAHEAPCANAMHALVPTRAAS